MKVKIKGHYILPTQYWKPWWYNRIGEIIEITNYTEIINGEVAYSLIINGKKQSSYINKEDFELLREDKLKRIIG